MLGLRVLGLSCLLDCNRLHLGETKFICIMISRNLWDSSQARIPWHCQFSASYPLPLQTSSRSIALIKHTIILPLFKNTICSAFSLKRPEHSFTLKDFMTYDHLKVDGYKLAFCHRTKIEK